MLEFGNSAETVLDGWASAGLSEPDALAVADDATRLSRAELSRRSADVAAALLESGVQRGDRVGVCVERSVGLIVALLGVLRAGAAYVAIDPAYPDERIAWMLADSAAAAVLIGADSRQLATPPTSAQLTLTADGHLAGGAGVLTDGGQLARAGVDLGTPSAPLGAADPAYVVYTSGSTGRPKGVSIDHAGLLNLVRWHIAAFDLSDADVCTQMASPGFDAAVWEIWPSLVAGAALHIVPETLRTDPLGLRDWMVARGVSVAFVPTAVAEGLMILDWPAEAPLRYMLIGGDALTRRPRPDLTFTVVNNYGVSEAAVVATSGAVTASGELPPSIGRPIDGVLAEIVNASGQPVPAGAEGELVLGGVAVGHGYLNLPELTAERFFTDARGRWYRTGDRMRFTPDGELEFRGRLDDQLSIRGFRVEAGEVAGALNAHPAIRASVAVGAGTTSAERRLIAYVAADGAAPSDAELSAFLAPRLPAHMHPDAYVWLDALPMTAHGKVDRAALPEAGPASAGVSGAGVIGEGTEPEEPRSESSVQATIAAIIAELLGVETIGAEENFFLLGGHSLLAAQLIVRLDELYDVEVSLRYLFDHPTARELAEEVDRERAASGAGEPQAAG